MDTGFVGLVLSSLIQVQLYHYTECGTCLKWQHAQSFFRHSWYPSMCMCHMEDTVLLLLLKWVLSTSPFSFCAWNCAWWDAPVFLLPWAAIYLRVALPTSPPTILLPWRKTTYWFFSNLNQATWCLTTSMMSLLNSQYTSLFTGFGKEALIYSGSGWLYPVGGCLQKNLKREKVRKQGSYVGVSCSKNNKEPCSILKWWSSPFWGLLRSYYVSCLLSPLVCLMYIPLPASWYYAPSDEVYWSPLKLMSIKFVNL